MDTSYHNQTTLHPLALVAFLATATWMFVGRRQAIVPAFLVFVCFVSQAQRVVVGGLDFTLTKLLIVAGFTRLLAGRELGGLRLRTMDVLLIAWLATTTIAYTVLRGGDSGAIANRLGWGWDVAGLYFLFRFSVRDWRDVDAIVRTLAWVAVPVAAVFALEKSTGHNAFSIFGGVEEITRIREGKLRCQGAFAHPIIAGVFWVGVLPLLVAARIRLRGAPRLAAIGSRRATLGIVATLFIVFATASSTPLAGVLLVAAGFAAWRVRHELRLLRWGALAALVALHFVREKPVWHLLSRIDLSGGSTGYHRFVLIDGAVRNVPEWGLLGSLDADFVAPGFSDITNQYVLAGLDGGLLGMLLFASLVVAGFVGVGRLLRSRTLPPERRILVWALGVALTAHAVSFLAVSYFGQATLVFYLLLALLAALPDLARSTSPATAATTPHAEPAGGAIIRPWHGAPA